MKKKKKTSNNLNRVVKDCVRIPRILGTVISVEKIKKKQENLTESKGKWRKKRKFPSPRALWGYLLDHTVLTTLSVNR